MSAFDYNKAWKQVYDYESKGLPESALKVVNEIYDKANAQKNAPQLVKAVIHILKFTDYKEEDAFVKNLNRLRDEAEKAQFPAKPLLHSMLAEQYWNYYQQNRWRFNNRTETVDFKNDDISTWTLEKLVQETVKHYQLSLQEAEQSKATKINLYDEVLYGSNEKGRAYRPTLYDFLAHRAVDFYMGEEPAITRPAETFVLQSPEYLSDAADFVKLNIVTKDELAFKYYALKIFQELLKSAPTGAASVDADLKRLLFVKQHSVLPNTTELYLQALQRLEEKNIKDPVSAIVTYHIAQVWVEKGSQYKPLQSDDHKFDARKAFEICETAKKRFPNSDGAKMCEGLQISIQTKLLSAQIEKVNVPGQPFRALVSYKNFTALHWRIIRTSREEVKEQRRKWNRNYNVDREAKFLEYFAAKPAAKTGKVTLPDDKDFQQHSVEIKLDGVPEGDYMVLFSHTPDFKTAKNGLAYAFTTISNLSYVHRNLDNGSTEFYAVHRQTGEPLPNVQAQVLFNRYNSKSQEYELVKGGIFKSDAKGRFTVPYQNN
ncbi:MAG: hypothetical protein MUD08_17380, partial [Cytophagales bacterium]|nr:hypothetical protein [Cytophagales bacterium]